LVFEVPILVFEVTIALVFEVTIRIRITNCTYTVVSGLNFRCSLGKVREESKITATLASRFKMGLLLVFLFGKIS
jgi:hypothetical protein